jgi:hypothetical protein
MSIMAAIQKIVFFSGIKFMLALLRENGCPAWSKESTLLALLFSSALSKRQDSIDSIVTQEQDQPPCYPMDF